LVIRYRAVPTKQPAARRSDAITPESNALPETTSNTVSDDSTPRTPGRLSESEETSVSVVTEAKQETVTTPQPFRATLPGFIFSGVLLGLLPMWNSAVFIVAGAVLAMLFIL